jgi:hypothetical protein
MYCADGEVLRINFVCSPSGETEESQDLRILIRGFEDFILYDSGVKNGHFILLR